MLQGLLGSARSSYIILRGSHWKIPPSPPFASPTARNILYIVTVLVIESTTVSSIALYEKTETENVVVGTSNCPEAVLNPRLVSLNINSIGDVRLSVIVNVTRDLFALSNAIFTVS